MLKRFISQSGKKSDKNKDNLEITNSSVVTPSLRREDFETDKDYLIASIQGFANGLAEIYAVEKSLDTANIHRSINRAVEIIKNPNENIVKNVESESTRYDEIIRTIPEEVLTTLQFFGTNNLNIGLRLNDTMIFFQCVEQQHQSYNLVRKSLYSEDMQPPNYLTLKLAEPIIKNSNHFKLNEINPFDYNMQFVGSFIEYIPESKSPATVSKQLHESEEEDATKNDAIIKFTTDIGMQACAMLDDISSKNVLWADFKLGNILLRKNGNIVITDEKAFYHRDAIALKASMIYSNDKDNQHYEEGNKKFIADLPKSDSYLSPNNENRLFTIFYQPSDNTPEDANTVRQALFNEWQKEYSFQLAISLYLLATNLKENSAESILISEKGKFDFNKPIFLSDKGQKLQTIIEQLGHPNPNDRLSIKDASKALAELDNSFKSTIETKQTRSWSVTNEPRIVKPQPKFSIGKNVLTPSQPITQINTNTNTNTNTKKNNTWSTHTKPKSSTAEILSQVKLTSGYRNQTPQENEIEEKIENKDEKKIDYSDLISQIPNLPKTPKTPDENTSNDSTNNNSSNTKRRM